MNEINEMEVFIMANYSTPFGSTLFGFLGDCVNALTEDVNPRTRDEYDDRPLCSDDYYAPRRPARRSVPVTTYDVELVISADSRYQSHMAYDFVRAIISNYTDLEASESGRMNYNVSERKVNAIIRNAERRGFNVMQRGNIIEIVDNRNNADVVIQINNSYRANDRW